MILDKTRCACDKRVTVKFQVGHSELLIPTTQCANKELQFGIRFKAVHNSKVISYDLLNKLVVKCQFGNSELLIPTKQCAIKEIQFNISFMAVHILVKVISYGLLK